MFYIFGVGVPYFSFGTLQENEIHDTALSDTNKYNLRILSSLNGFVECRASFYVQWGMKLSQVQNKI